MMEVELLVAGRVGQHAQMDRWLTAKSRLGQYWAVYITNTAGGSQEALAATDFQTVDEVFDHDRVNLTRKAGRVQF